MSHCLKKVPAAACRNGQFREENDVGCQAQPRICAKHMLCRKQLGTKLACANYAARPNARR
jgi:hypothetical protein